MLLPRIYTGYLHVLRHWVISDYIIVIYILCYSQSTVLWLLHCKFRRVVLTPGGHFRPFKKRVVSTPRNGRFNSKGSFDSVEGSK